MNTWQPIETAPKDGTEVLLFWHVPAHYSFAKRWEAADHYEIGKWVEMSTDDYQEVEGGLFAKVSKPFFKGWWGIVHSGVSLFRDPLQPSHWCPLPERPEGVGEQGVLGMKEEGEVR